jgi:hypothetical protein
MSYCPSCAKLERELAEQHELFGKEIDRGVNLVEEKKELLLQLAKAISALEEIKEGKGEYNRDKFVHAVFTIERMKAIASTTLAELRGGSSRSPAQATGGGSPEIASAP